MVCGFSEGLRLCGFSLHAATLGLVDLLGAVDHHFAHGGLDLRELQSLVFHLSVVLELAFISIDIFVVSRYKLA